MNPRTPLPSVLVVDDNADAADTLAGLLTLKGYATRTAYRGRDALTLATADPPDAVILDLLMPGMDGWDLAGRLAELPRPPLVIAVSGRGGDRDRIRSAWTGIRYHFTKPADPALIFAVLDRLAAREAEPVAAG